MEKKGKKNEHLQCFSSAIKKPINCKPSDFIISYLFEYLFIFMFWFFVTKVVLFTDYILEHLVSHQKFTYHFTDFPEMF